MTVKPGTSAPRGSTEASPQAVRTQDFAALEALREAIGFDADAMAAYLGVSRKTYRRRAAAGTLDADESLKTEMLRRVLDEAVRVLGGDEAARRWLTTPIASLDSRRPIDHLRSIQGYERVKTTLVKIEYGTY